MSALRGQEPPGAVPGAAVCRPCQLRGRAGGRGGEGAVQAQRCQQAAIAQPRPPGQGAEGPCLAAAGESLPVPSVPLISQPQGDPQRPSACWQELCSGVLCSHLAPPSWRPSSS